MALFQPSLKDRAAFARNLSVLIQSGIPLNESLSLLIEEARSYRMRSILQHVNTSIQGGTSLSAAFEHHRNAFGNLFVQVIRAGELSGTLEENLIFLADLMDARADLRSKVRASILYPEIVLVMALVLGGGLSLFILPKLTTLFVSLGTRVPLPTRILIAMTKFLQGYWLFLLIGVGLAIALVIVLRRLPETRAVYQRILLHMPFIGTLLKKYQLALICQVFHTMYKSGLSILEIMEGGADASTNVLYQKVLRNAMQSVASGVPISQALGTSPDLFPRNFMTIVAVGEKSGTLEQSFMHLTASYQRDVDDRIKKLPVILEPILLISIGCIVGFVAISVILPIYQLTQSFRVQ